MFNLGRPISQKHINKDTNWKNYPTNLTNNFQNQLPLLDDEPFYHICITLFSFTIVAKTVIKAKNIAHITPSIIQKTQKLNIQWSGLKLVKSSYLVGSVDRKTYISIWVACCQDIAHCCPWVIYIYQTYCKAKKENLNWN